VTGFYELEKALFSVTKSKERRLLSGKEYMSIPNNGVIYKEQSPYFKHLERQKRECLTGLVSGMLSEESKKTFKDRVEGINKRLIEMGAEI